MENKRNNDIVRTAMLSQPLARKVTQKFIRPTYVPGSVDAGVKASATQKYPKQGSCRYSSNIRSPIN